MRALVRLYPRAWRDRYEDEFLAVLEARPVGPFDTVDVALGALDAHRRAAGRRGPMSPRKEISMSTRFGGLAAVATGVLWFGFLAIAAIPDGNALIGVVALILGLFALAVAVVGLGAAQSRAHPVATWIAVLVPVIGVGVALSGFVVLSAMYGDVPLIGDFTPWWIGTVGIMLVLGGAALFGLVTLISSVLSRTAAALIAFGGLGSLVIAIAGSSGIGAVPEILMRIALIAAATAFGVGWLWLGRSAIQTTPRPA